MKRTEFLRNLDDYATTWAAGLAPYDGLSLAEEQRLLTTFRSFVESTSHCFERTWSHGHITGSALIVSPDLTQVLLTLHGKLNKWLQLGGHADGHHLPHEVALRETEEESGLTHVRLYDYETQAFGRAAGATPLPFDLDCHLIPARKTDPEHAHYDVRYLIIGDPTSALGITEESQDLRWFPIAEARRLNTERSMERQFDKLLWLRQRHD